MKILTYPIKNVYKTKPYKRMTKLETSLFSCTNMCKQNQMMAIPGLPWTYETVIRASDQNHPPHPQKVAFKF